MRVSAKPHLEFCRVGDDAVDPLSQAQTIAILIGARVKIRKEAGAKLGLATVRHLYCVETQAGMLRHG